MGAFPLQPIDPKVKAAFTRTFNKSAIRPRCNLDVAEFKRGRRGGGKGKGKGGGDEEDEEAATNGARRMHPLPAVHMAVLAWQHEPGWSSVSFAGRAHQGPGQWLCQLSLL